MTTTARPSAARERILETAFALFYARGIRAVGVDLIIAESGVAKATFYKHFPAKDDLVVAYLDKVDGVWTGQLEAAAEAAGPDPADQLREARISGDVRACREAVGTARHRRDREPAAPADPACRSGSTAARPA